jgi:hypothetical protein
MYEEIDKLCLLMLSLCLNDSLTKLSNFTIFLTSFTDNFPLHSLSTVNASSYNSSNNSGLPTKSIIKINLIKRNFTYISKII